ncbi:hypothetical protein FDP41_008466 [Naegleria fowleri]|uniref:Uncharacterized protein n=1 Tax=Naegleria fowleri TaxID=5763 RepID=A0A6A5BK92_NAEFO|nr:uncharacterized protein FDP41_008466 [Naegleria fowleri]KAF0973259.1 hypothetical protein FDP41_008466 [Naegleria fowleri]CAG4711946.1 unnamed protein product [Naegleria fowleri]
MEAKTVRLVVVGDGAVGKTCLLHVFAKGEFPEKYIPTIFDNYSSEIEVNNETINFLLMDTAGQEDYDHIRPLSYPDANVFLLCFSVDSPTSLDNIKNKWVPEVRKHRPNCPLVLVGTKADIREDKSAVAKLKDQGTEIVSKEMAEQVAKAIKAVKYMECSAMKNNGVKEVFEEALYNGLYPPEVKTEKKKNSCLIL